MTEKHIEDYLVKKVKAMGGKAYKLNSPGSAGMPDRLVCLPGGVVFFLELKATGKKPTALQNKRMKELKRLGQTVVWLDSTILIDALLASKVKKCADESNQEGD